MPAKSGIRRVSKVRATCKPKPFLNVEMFSLNTLLELQKLVEFFKTNTVTLTCQKLKTAHLGGKLGSTNCTTKASASAGVLITAYPSVSYCIFFIVVWRLLALHSVLLVHPHGWNRYVL